MHSILSVNKPSEPDAMRPRDDNQTRNYKFGPLEFSVRGLGVFVGGDKLRERISALSLAELRQANREAWRQRNASVRAANRQQNVTVHGWDDARDHHIEVCAVVCKETWKMMR